MSTGFVLLVYNLLLPVGLLFVLPRYLSKMRSRGGYEGHFAQRRARYPKEILSGLQAMNKPVWIHAVSVGEVLIAVKLIAELRRQSPGVDIVLSTTTSTGYQQAKEKGGEGVLAIYNPLDFRPTAKRALRLIDPGQLVLVEAEVWPNLVSLARKRGVPVTLVNARLSERSERRFRRFGFFVRPVFAMLDHVFVQTEEDVARLKGIGARANAVQCMGSIKYDPQGAAKPDQVDGFVTELGRLFGKWKPKILLAGSTHDGEESLLGAKYLVAKESYPDLFYIAVPRHFERADQVLTQMREAGLKPLLRTGMEDALDGSCGQGGMFDCLVVNTTGELRAWYYTADAVVIGKSFLSKGGQNPVEAILADKPVIYGPHMGNFAVLARALDACGGARRIEDADALPDALLGILRGDETASGMVENARSVLATHEGATTRTAECLLRGGDGADSGFAEIDLQNRFV